MITSLQPSPTGAFTPADEPVSAAHRLQAQEAPKLAQDQDALATLESLRGASKGDAASGGGQARLAEGALEEPDAVWRRSPPGRHLAAKSGAEVLALGGVPTAAAAPSDATPARPAPTTSAAPTPSAGGSQDDPVFGEVKAMSASLKAVLEAAVAKAKRQHAQDAGVRAAADAVDAADKTVLDAGRDIGGLAGSYSAVRQNVAATPVTPAVVSVQA